MINKYESLLCALLVNHPTLVVMLSKSIKSHKFVCCVISSCLIVTRDHVTVSQVRYLGGDHWPDPYQAGSQIQ